MGETLFLASTHDAVLDFLRGRDDAVLYGAQAVNAYVNEARMTQDVDVMSTRGAELAEEIASFLHQRFAVDLTIRPRRFANGIVHRIYQVREPPDRHLVDVRAVGQLPPARRVDGVLVLAPVELVCETLLFSMGGDGLHRADLWRLLLQFPELKQSRGPVRDQLVAMIAGGSPRELLSAWDVTVEQTILPDDDESKFR